MAPTRACPRRPEIRLAVLFALGDVREEQFVGPLSIALDAGDLEAMAAREPLDEALLVVGVARQWPR